MRRSELFLLCVRVLILLAALPMASTASSGDFATSGPLRSVAMTDLERLLPGAKLMTTPAAIEGFLAALDGKPPDWNAVYGRGHHDPGHDDRLFALNRERDGKRAGNPALSTQIAFVWAGVLSSYDPVGAGFPVALGPKFINTAWGIVRFKPEEAPGNLRVVADAAQQIQLERLFAEGRPLEIDVVMRGRLIPEESIVYDFSHDEEGVGLIMPFVRVEQVDFFLVTP
ncbi:MAG TPA: hypothetical protein VJR03_03425 [Nitrospira sp.]|nr:hypothetical protein [Nitrospira sp.]